MKYFVFILALYSVHTFFSKRWNKFNLNSDIYWSKEVKLRWRDFRGIPPEQGNNSDYVAFTYSIIWVTPYEYKSYPNYIVAATFIKEKSWARDSSLELLQHEQLHFDMTELFARKIRKSIDSLRFKKVNDKTIYMNKIKYWIGTADKQGSIYDEETYHGVYKEAQEKWNQKIADELEGLSKYAVDYQEYIKNE